MNRRRFLQLGIAAGVTASAGFDLTHFLSWLWRNPRWSFPTEAHPISTYVMGGDAVHVIPASDMFPELGQLTTIYYDRKALDNLKRNFILTLANEKVEAQQFGGIYKPVLKTKQGLVVV